MFNFLFLLRGDFISFEQPPDSTWWTCNTWHCAQMKIPGSQGQYVRVWVEQLVQRTCWYFWIQFFIQPWAKLHFVLLIGALVSTWLFADPCLGLRLGSSLIKSCSPSSSSYVFVIISIDKCLLNAWKYIFSFSLHTQFRKQRNALTSDTARKKDKQRRAHRCVFHVSSMDGLILYVASDCCHLHNLFFQ